MIGVSSIPGRKRKALIDDIGAAVQVLAYFRNQECVDLFLESINRMLNDAYQQGVAAGKQVKR